MAAIHSSNFRTSMFKLKKLTENYSSLKIFFDRCSSIYMKNALIFFWNFLSSSLATNKKKRTNKGKCDFLMLKKTWKKIVRSRFYFIDCSNMTSRTLCKIFRKFHSAVLSQFDPVHIGTGSFFSTVVSLVPLHKTSDTL